MKSRGPGVLLATSSSTSPTRQLVATANYNHSSYEEKQAHHGWLSCWQTSIDNEHCFTALKDALKSLSPMSW